MYLAKIYVLLWACISNYSICPSFAAMFAFMGKDHIYDGYETKKPFWPTFWWLHSSITPWPIHLLLQLWLLQMVFILLWLGYNYCSGWLLTRRFATRILLLKPSAWTPNATVVHGTHESYKFMISSSGVISMFDFSHISSQLAQPERLAPQFVLTTIIKLKFGKKRKTECEARCLDTFISEILNLKIKIGIEGFDALYHRIM